MVAKIGKNMQSDADLSLYRNLYRSDGLISFEPGQHIHH